MTNGLLSFLLNFLPMSFWANRIIHLQISSLYFDFASIAMSCFRDWIRASLATTHLQNQPRGSEACVWNIWKDVKLLTLVFSWMVSFPAFSGQVAVSSFSFSFLCSRCRGAQKAHRAVPNEALYGVLRRSRLITWTYLLRFSCQFSAMGRG